MFAVSSFVQKSLSHLCFVELLKCLLVPRAHYWCTDVFSLRVNLRHFKDVDGVPLSQSLGADWAHRLFKAGFEFEAFAFV